MMELIDIHFLFEFRPICIILNIIADAKANHINPNNIPNNDIVSQSKLMMNAILLYRSFSLSVKVMIKSFDFN